MMDDSSQQSSGAEHGAPNEYLALFPESCNPRSSFDAALCALIGVRPRRGLNGMRDGRRAAMIEALDRKATWQQIRRWRRGIGPAPQWAIDILRRKLGERIATAKHIDSLLTGRPA